MAGKDDRDRIIFQGEVIEALRDKFKVQISENHTAICTLSGKIRQNSVKILQGDIVNVELSEYDMSKGRIIYRIKQA